MLLITKYLFLTSVFIVLITGCVRKTSSNAYSYNNSYSSNNLGNNNRSYAKIPNEKIRNSKAMHRATMKSYVIAGIRYYPTLASVGDELNGIASWYGPNFHAKLTSNGETYDMYALTAAHKTLPMNTIVKVVNLENNKSIIVRVNDRGPFVAGRIIDLSNKAAHAIDMVKKGTARVKVYILGFNASIAKTSAQKQEVATVDNYFIQIGAFSSYDGASNVKRKFDLILEDRYDIIIKKPFSSNDKLNRVWVSGFKSFAEAKDFKENNGLENSLIIAQ